MIQFLRHWFKTVSFDEALAILDACGKRYFQMALFSFGASSWFGHSRNWNLIWFKGQPHELEVKRWYGKKSYGINHRVPRRLLPASEVAYDQ